MVDDHRNLIKSEFIVSDLIICCINKVIFVKATYIFGLMNELESEAVPRAIERRNKNYR